MDRRQVLERLQEYVDGEIADATERDEMRRLIETDPDLNAAYRQAKKYTTTLLDALSGLRTDDGFESGLIERIRAERQGGRDGGETDPASGRPRIRLWPYLLLVGVMLALTVGILILRSGPPSVGTLKYFQGPATLLRLTAAGTHQHYAVAEGDPIQHDDRLTVETDGKLILDLRGNELTMDENTEAHFYYRVRDKETVVYIVSGRVSLKARRGPAVRLQAGQVIVEKKAGIVAEFSLAVNAAGAIAVNVRAGRVIASDATRSVVVTPDNPVTLAGAGQP